MSYWVNKVKYYLKVGLKVFEEFMLARYLTVSLEVIGHLHEVEAKSFKINLL